MACAAAPAAARYRLGDYREYAPPGALAAVVEAVWIHRVADDAPLAEGAMHRVLPDLALSLAFRCRRDAEGRPAEARLIVIGPKSRPHVFTFARGWETAAIRVKLEWVEPLLDLVPAEHADAERDLSAIQPSARWLFDQLVETRSGTEAAAALGRAVLQQARRRHDLRTEAAAQALDLVRRTAGTMPVEGIAHATGSSVRHLRRTVRRDAGISLKAYARVTRLLRAVTAADRSPSPAWARIAADCGFCDQSHLVRDCRALTGLSPGEVHRERRAEAETSNPG